MAESNIVEESTADVLHTALADSSGDVYAVCPSEGAITDLVTILGTLESPPTVRLLAPESTLKEVMEDFVVAGSAADLVEEGVLAVRTVDLDTGTVLVDEVTVVSVVSAGDRVAGLVTADESFVGAAATRYAEVWSDAEEYGIRTPPLSRVRSTLEADIGPETANDFDAVLESLGTIRGDAELDEVTISLLVAARNRELLYDISKWGEDVGIASKATFSRTKTKLEDTGLIDTEKVPIDVGRPRLRLLLGDERLADADIDEFAGVAQSMLSA
jgi:hypothetical protein